jgi:hypothetical protein
VVHDSNRKLEINLKLHSTVLHIILFCKLLGVGNQPHLNMHYTDQITGFGAHRDTLVFLRGGAPHTGASESMKLSRTGHRGCSRGWTGGTQDTAVETGEVRMGVSSRHLLPPAFAGGMAAVQRPPRPPHARTQASKLDGIPPRRASQP